MQRDGTQFSAREGKLVIHGGVRNGSCVIKRGKEPAAGIPKTDNYKFFEELASRGWGGKGGEGLLTNLTVDASGQPSKELKSTAFATFHKRS
jgi:hypothetical protein